MTTNPEHAIIQTLVDTRKRESFTGGYKSTDAEAFGLLMASYFGHGARILDAAAKALEDANFHTESAQVAAMYQAILKADDDEPIDDDMRKALLARMSEVYGKSITSPERRVERLSILTTLADRAIFSVSRRGNMTVGDFKRVMRVLDTFGK
jgi:hypothetical protein